MLSLQDVMKVRIVTTEKHREELIKALYSFGLIQVVSAGEEQFDKPLPEYAEISSAMVYLRGIAKKYGLGEPTDTGLAKGFEDYKEFYLKTRESFRSYEEKISAAQEKYDKVAAAGKYASDFTAHPGKMSTMLKGAGAGHIHLSFVQPSNKNELENIRNALYKTNAIIVENKRDKAETAPIAIIYSKALTEDVAKAIESHATVLAGVTHVSDNETFKAVAERLKVEEKAAAKELAASEGEFSALLAKQKPKILSLMGRLETLSTLSTLPLKFGKAKNLIVVDSWIPTSIYKDLEECLNEDLISVVSIEKVATDEKPPTLLDNPKFAQPFEALVGFFSLPNRNELDPTALIAITFPLFFGLILGDVGYGLIGVLLALFMRAKFSAKFMQDVSSIMLMSSVSTMLFGLVFGEVFGKEEIFGIVFHSYIPRVTSAGTTLMIVICLGIGAIHLFIGYLLGAINAITHHDHHHLMAKISWMTMEIGFVATAIVMTASGTSILGIDKGLASIITMLLGFAGVVGIIKTEGIGGGIEIFSFISNVFSYLRIIALGLSGAILAGVINGIPVDFGAIGGMIAGTQPFNLGTLIGIVLFALLFVLGHLMAFVLGIFECSIQSLRLHYVEFFSKFYQGGGISFSPLRVGSVKRCKE